MDTERLMDTECLVRACRTLAKREGIPRKNIEGHIGLKDIPEHIRFWSPTCSSEAACPSKYDEVKAIGRWADAHGLDGVVWTALPPKLGTLPPKCDECERTPGVCEVDVCEVLDYLRRLEGAQRRHAEEYVRRAPRQIDTAYRRKIEAELHWTPVDPPGGEAV